MRTLAVAACVALVAAPAALAQSTQSAGRSGQLAGACGQPLALTHTLSMPVDQVAAAPLQGAFERAEPFYLEFTLGEATRVALRTEVGDDSTDPYLSVLDRSGTVIAADDDSAGGFDAILDLTLDPGTYCAQVRPVSGSTDALQPVTLRLATGRAVEELMASVVLPPGPADLCTDPALTADLDRALAPGVGSFTLQAAVDPDSRRDWRLSVSAPMELQIDARSGQFDTTLTLVDGAGGIVAENDDGPNTGTDSRIALAVEPGEYCLSLSGYEGGSGLAEVAFSDTPDAVIVGPIGSACSDPALTSELGVALAPGLGSYSLSSSVEAGSRSDWRFDVTEAVEVQFDLRSGDFDTLMSLVDASGSLLDQNDDGPDGTNSRIVRTLSPGSYCLAVEGFGGSGGAFDLALTDTPSAGGGGMGGGAAQGLCSDPAQTAELGTAAGPGFGGLTAKTDLPPGGRRDFRLSVGAPMTLSFGARSGSFDTMLRLATPDGAVLAENDDGPGGGTDSAFDLALAPGEYCLALESFAGGGGAAEVSVTEGMAGAGGTTGGGAAGGDPVALGEAVPGPDSGVAVEDLGVLADRLESSRTIDDQTKWLAFTVDVAGPVRVDAISLGGSFTLRLYAEAGDRLGDSFGAGGISPARIEMPLDPGRYLVAVTLDPYASSKLRNVSITRP
jgi:hypothetical protein